MGQTPGEIRHDIEQTRDRMGATIDAIGYRLDVPARMRYRFSHIMHDVSGAFGGAKAGDGDGGDLLAMGEEKVSSMLQAAQSGISGIAGAVEERVSSAGQTVQSGLTGIKESLVDTMTTTGDRMMTGAGSTTDQMQQQVQQQMYEARDTAVSAWRRIGGFAKDNALALGLGAFAVGIIAGLFIPRSKVEDEKIGPLAGEVRHKAVETGEKVIQRGQEMAQHTMDSMSGRQGGQGQGEPVGAGSQTSGTA